MSAEILKFTGGLEKPLIIVNPLGHPQLDPAKVLMHWSNVLGWFDTTRDRNMSARDVVEHWYRFPMYASTGSTILANGVMRFPGDPDQIPVVSIERYDETMYCYPFDFIAIVGPLATYVTRID